MTLLKNPVSMVVTAFILMLYPLSYAAAKMNNAELETLPIALAGYDVTSYYTNDGPHKGENNYQAVYQQQRYLFTSKEHQQEFAANPKKYVPKFGHRCAFALSQEVSMPADPSIFKVTDDNLLFFSNQQALANWQVNEAESLAKAQEFSKFEYRYDADKRLREDTEVRLFSF